ncbi:MAG TPA: hypothetical protein VLS85_07880 [Hanamia sp.]|nr:hypothetical protein [Hanamia sp.]
MKRIIDCTILYIALFLLPFSVTAQSLADFGNAKLIIESGDLKGTYNYSMENGAPLSFTEDAGGDHADFSFESDFDNKKGGSHWIQCIFRITPPGKGTYLFKDPSAAKDPPKEADLSINIDNKMVMDGNAGNVIVTNYPATNGYLIGTFSGAVSDISQKISYKISGAFKIKRLQ